jgi:multiple sugar transport system ATP-binding protein
MVFQNYALYPHMSVYKNMAFGLKLRKMPKEEIDQRVREAAGILGIESLLERKPKALSGGQRQRVALGRAIVRQPQAFLFDEPLSNLDAKMRVQMRMEISRLHQKLQSTMIYVTHDQVEAMTMGHRIAVMKDGVMQQVDTPMEIYRKPINRFVAGFIGSPPMNFFAGTLEQGEDGLRFRNENLLLRIHDRHVQALRDRGAEEVTLGVRPEHLRISEGEAPSTGLPRMKAQVDVVEPMGAEVMLYLRTGETPFTARVDGRDTTRAGQPLEIEVDMEQACYFESGEDGSCIA